MTVIVTHVPTNKSKTFEHPRDAAAFYETCIARKLSPDDLSVDNDSGVAISAYSPILPDWAQNLIERLEKDHGGNNVKTWRFIDKRGHGWRDSTGRAWTHKKRILVSIARHDTDLKGVIIHEFAHILSPHEEHHGRIFYRTFFKLLRIYCNWYEEESIARREFNYIKSSKYWYAELWDRKDMLAAYEPQRAVAIKKTPEQKAQETIAKLFEDL